jgi:fructose-1,6-bisphosphatase I
VAGGGAARDGRRPILDIVPSANHQRTPIYIGSTADVSRVETFVVEAGSRTAAVR